MPLVFAVIRLPAAADEDSGLEDIVGVVVEGEVLLDLHWMGDALETRPTVLRGLLTHDR